MPRIAFVSDVAYPWVKGGVQATEHKEMRELAKRHEVYSFSLMFEGMKPSFVKDGVHYIAFRKSSAKELYVNGKRSVALARAFAAGIANAMHGYAFDLVVANAFPYLHLPAVKRYCKKSGAKLVLEVAEVWDAGYWKEYMGRGRGILAYLYMKRALQNADAYIANSSTTAAKLSAIGIAKERIRIFSPLLDNSYSVGKARMSADRLLYVGRLAKEKRVDLMISAVGKAVKLLPSLKALLVGEGPEEGPIKSMIARYGLDDTVKVIPHVEKESKLREIIRESKLLVNMSEREGLSAIAIEALALGTPVLLPSYTPIPNEVKRMCVVMNVEDIPRAMVQMVRAKDKRRFIKHSEGLAQFRVSMTNEFYSKLISELAVHSG